jgi:hypothetical protein
MIDAVTSLGLPVEALAIREFTKCPLASKGHFFAAFATDGGNGAQHSSSFQRMTDESAPCLSDAWSTFHRHGAGKLL